MTSEIYKIRMRDKFFISVHSPDESRLSEMVGEIVGLGGHEISPCCYALSENVTNDELQLVFRGIAKGEYVHVIRSEKEGVASYVIVAPRE